MGKRPACVLYCVVVGLGKAFMNPLSNILAVGSYAIVAGALAIVLPAGLGLGGGAAVLVGIGFFVVAGLAHWQLLRGRELVRLQNDVVELSVLEQQLRDELAASSERLRMLAKSVSALDVVTNREVLAEMRVLEDMLLKMERRRQNAETRAVENPGPSSGQFLSPPAAAPAAISSTVPLQTVSAALEENRVDLYLQPIVSLPQRKTRFFEGYSRLRDAEGQVIEPAQYLSIAEQAGLISTIDNLLLLRCVQLIRRLHHRNRSAVIFCNISAHSLRDEDFFPQFVDFMEQNSDLAGSLIFEFSQETVRSNGEQEWAQLARLAARDYRFSIDRVADLTMSFDELAARNFTFIKLSADSLSSRVDELGATLQSSDLKRVLRAHGIDLIAEKIEDEAMMVELLDFELDYGQGFLFGEPRRSRGPEEMSREDAKTARHALAG